ncbi:AGZA family xanthine/uracil permease-like MFS transporter [Melghirimyces profundicolus]|uniref:AGZA family xanthine/uracil permease-like MFS transporter n=1 Tax=Melghirimyces profundicolus TaxID=1242148 RepID=A0A2T6AZV5_9BACL|nr:NCS2 family permease [Melghirimyces profundicolus]PTX49341.1 AGZA family xanthine/uracil permease-like MFS transporter [Melghirimyces profundicolus]
MDNRQSVLSRFFGFGEHNTNLKTEVLAGATTFLTMAYILLVNPFLLGKEAGMDFGAVFVATALAAAIGTLLMGLVANYPIALAPGMGLNAYFTYTVVLGMGVSWETALGAVFISGVIFLLLTVTRVRELIINSIPPGLKHAVSAGIGLFIAFIGLKNAQLIVANEATFVALNGNLMKPEILLTLFGLVLTLFLMIRQVKGAVFFGMIGTAVAGIAAGVVDMPSKLFSAPPSLSPTFLKMDLAGALDMGFFAIIFAFLFVDLFDTAGTLVGVSNQAGLLKNNRLPRAGRALTADSVATMSGAALGTSTVTSYIESTAGVATGGRTGMTSVTAALLFLMALFFFPLVEAFASVAAITSPALVIVGVLMASSLKEIEWKDLTEAVPAFLTVLMMPLAFSIATGIAIGFILYPVTKLFGGKAREVHPILYILALIFISRFLFLGSI